VPLVRRMMLVAFALSPACEQAAPRQGDRSVTRCLSQPAQGHTASTRFSLATRLTLPRWQGDGSMWRWSSLRSCPCANPVCCLSSPLVACSWRSSPCEATLTSYPDRYAQYRFDPTSRGSMRRSSTHDLGRP
jgi:hypothetical protein